MQDAQEFTRASGYPPQVNLLADAKKAADLEKEEDERERQEDAAEENEFEEE